MVKFTLYLLLYWSLRYICAHFKRC